MATTILGAIFPDFLNRFFEVLATPIISNGYAEIMVGWGLIHFFAGFLIMYFLIKSEEKRIFLTAILILFTFEVFEFSVSYILPVILRETFLDTAWDLIIGFFGILLAFLIFRNRNP